MVEGGGSWGWKIFEKYFIVENPLRLWNLNRKLAKVKRAQSNGWQGVGRSWGLEVASINPRQNEVLILLYSAPAPGPVLASCWSQSSAARLRRHSSHHLVVVVAGGKGEGTSRGWGRRWAEGCKGWRGLKGGGVTARWIFGSFVFWLR